MIMSDLPYSIIRKMARILNPKSGSTIVNPACGTGRFFEVLLLMYPKRQLNFVGYDISDTYIEYCKGKFNGVFEVRDILNWEKEYNSDIVFMQPPLHADIYSYAREVALKHNKGCIYIPLRNVEIYEDYKEYYIRKYSKYYLRDILHTETTLQQGYMYWRKH
jgi:SAM-dependent methyltransferase